jgi:transketolase
MVSETLEAAKELEKSGISCEVINMHTIKPLDEALLLASAAKTKAVVTVEEHSVIGGLGSAVADTLSEQLPTRLLKIGVCDVFGESGPALELLHKYGLDAEGIATKVASFCRH